MILANLLFHQVPAINKNKKINKNQLKKKQVYSNDLPSVSLTCKINFLGCTSHSRSYDLERICRSFYLIFERQQEAQPSFSIKITVFGLTKDIFSDPIIFSGIASQSEKKEKKKLAKETPFRSFESLKGFLLSSMLQMRVFVVL